MPELPEVETTRRGLVRRLKSRRITEIELRRRDLRFPLPDDFEARLLDRTITGLRRRAKYLLIDLDSKDVWLSHLGMSGSFRVVAPGEYEAKKHDHVVLALDDGMLCVFHDPRRFGFMDVFHEHTEKENAYLKNLGPEPLSDDFDAAYLAAQLAKRSGPIKPALMDQKLVVGVGNIYASESLFSAGLNPQVPAKNATKHAAALVASIKATLESALASGGSSLRDYVRADGESGYFQHRFLVYERDGEPCTACKGNINSMVQAGRTTYWCARCQPMPRKVKKT